MTLPDRCEDTEELPSLSWRSGLASWQVDQSSVYFGMRAPRNRLRKQQRSSLTLLLHIHNSTRMCSRISASWCTSADFVVRLSTKSSCGPVATVCPKGDMWLLRRSSQALFAQICIVLGHRTKTAACLPERELPEI